MRVAFLTREYPPEVYGGAGVYAEHMAGELNRRVDLVVHCFGGPRSGEVATREYAHWEKLDGKGPHLAALQSMAVDLAMAAGVEGAELVHSNTWYTNLAGHLAKLLYRIPHVVTSHSLEPLRRWKSEQLGGGYALSSFCERVALESADALIAVSGQMRDDIIAQYPAIDPVRIHVIHNGIDVDAYKPDAASHVLERLGISADRPIALFVGRITRQKGIIHLLRAAETLDSAVQLVLCAAAPDTVEIAQEFQQLVARLQRTRKGVFWIEKMLPRRDVVQLLTHARTLVCPSVYEPFGLVNVEAMACETAVVATAESLTITLD
jgi:starch synthase